MKLQAKLLHEMKAPRKPDWRGWENLTEFLELICSESRFSWIQRWCQNYLN